MITYENNLAVQFEEVKIFGGDPWHQVQDGKIKNLDVTSKKDCKCPGT